MASSSSCGRATASITPATPAYDCCMATMVLMWSMFRVSDCNSSVMTVRSRSSLPATRRRKPGSCLPRRSSVRKRPKSVACALTSPRVRFSSAIFEFLRRSASERGGDVHAVEHVAEVVQHAGGDFGHAGARRAALTKPTVHVGQLLLGVAAFGDLAAQYLVGLGQLPRAVSTRTSNWSWAACNCRFPCWIWSSMALNSSYSVPNSSSDCFSTRIE